MGLKERSINAVPSGYKASKVGVIPVDWEVKRIGDVTQRVVNPVNVKMDEKYQQLGIRSHGKGIFYKEKVSGEALGNKRVFWVEPNCFIVNIVFAWERAVAITTQQDQGIIASHRFPMYKPKNNQIDICFLNYFFITKRGASILELASPGGAGRNKTLGQKEFSKSKILIPPIEEQKKIAEILSTQDKIIELKEQLLEEKKKQKKYLMQVLLNPDSEHFIRLNGFEGEWETRRIKDIAKVVGGGTPSTSEQTYWDGKINWFTPSEIQGRYANESKRKITNYGLSKSSAKLLPINTVLFTSRASIGLVSIAIKECSTNQGFQSIIVNENYDYLFVYYLLQVLKKEFLKKSNGTTFLEIYKKDVEKQKIGMPKQMKEQLAISKMLNDVDISIELAQKEIRCVYQKKKALMQQLLTGKVRVKI